MHLTSFEIQKFNKLMMIRHDEHNIQIIKDPHKTRLIISIENELEQAVYNLPQHISSYESKRMLTSNV